MWKLDRLFEKYSLTLTVLLYFSIHLINLTALPVFNDESIYLDWGFREINVPGFLYYSLYDSKPPLVMWIFGISQKIFSDPLLAGRLVSVFFGFFTLLGIYFLSKEVGGKKLAIVSTVIYVLIPVFIFYNRQALMEAAVACFGIWALYFLLKNLKNFNSIKFSILAGVFVGLSFFTKFSAVIFLMTTVIIYSYYSFKRKDLKNISAFLTSFFIVNLLLFINPLFWSTLSKNSQYSLTLSEIIRFPINTWLNNLLGNIEIVFVFATPLVFIFSILGILLIKKARYGKIIIFWFLLGLLFQTLIVRETSQRYLVSYLPLLSIFSGYFILYLSSKYKLMSKTITLLFFAIIMSVSFYQIKKPDKYIYFLAKISEYAETSYLQTFTSGYGLSEVLSFIKNESRGNEVFVAIAQNTGNPESAINIYFKDGNIQSTYLDKNLLGEIPNQKKCINTGRKTFFVSRQNQLAGLDRFFIKINEFKNPYDNNYFLGLYALKENCSDEETLHLTNRREE